MAPPLDKRKLPKDAEGAVGEAVFLLDRLQTSLTPAEWRVFLRRLKDIVDAKYDRALR